MPSSVKVSVCPCGASADYVACCGQYIEAGAVASTPEKLMRSRYVAFTQSNMDYIKKTMRGAPLQQFDDDYNKEWADSVEWLKLEVIAAHTQDDFHGVVEFNAYYRLNGLVKCLHENSIFEKIDGIWYYTGNNDIRVVDSAEHKKPKVGRNDPCYCGSGKKYKKCCYAKDRH